MNLRTTLSLAAFLALAACAAPPTAPQQPERLSGDTVADNRVLIIFHDAATGTGRCSPPCGNTAPSRYTDTKP